MRYPTHKLVEFFFFFSFCFLCELSVLNTLHLWFIFQVVIRVRPLNNNEKNLHSYNRCLKQESAQSITWIGHPETRFTFDHVACETVDQVSLKPIWLVIHIWLLGCGWLPGLHLQEVLFRVAGLPMVENCMAGYNSCVFAYGQVFIKFICVLLAAKGMLS